MATLESLLSEIEDGLIERIVLVEGKTIDEIFGERDAAEFEDRLMALDRDVKARKTAAAQNATVVEIITRIRELVFLKVFQRWQSDDLAAYTSDDFGLIADAVASGFEDPRISQMLENYRSGTIPTEWR